MKAKLIAISLPSKTMNATRAFFSSLLGFEPARALSDVESYHVGVADGVYLWLSTPFWEGDTAPTVYFAVDDLEEASRAAAKAGGQVAHDRMSVEMAGRFLPAYEQTLREKGVTDPISNVWGKVQMMRIPGGCLIGLCEVEPHSQIFYGIGKYKNGQVEASIRADLQRASTLAANFF